MKRRSGVRPAVAAFAGTVFTALILRTFAAGVGPDEFSLLAMAQSIRDGALPYAAYWDVRPPLAYLWALPSAYVENAATSVALLRLLAWAAQAGAAWLFFCLFQRSLGVAAAAVGTLTLLGAANMTGLHAAALPNHFSMATSVAAFACLVAGLRRPGGAAYFASALLAGLLPWMMTHAGLVALSLAALVMLADPANARAWPANPRIRIAQPAAGGPWERGLLARMRAGRPHSQASGHRCPAAMQSPGKILHGALGNALQPFLKRGLGFWPGRHPLWWLLVASAPSVALAAAYYLWGPFDAFVRTVFAAPFGVLDMRSAGGGHQFLFGDEVRRVLAASPWAAVQALLLGAGALWLAGAVRTAPKGSPLRFCPFLAAPLAAGFAVMAYVKPPAPPEYWIDMAPVAALLAAVAASRVMAWPGWAARRVARHIRPAVLRPCLAAGIAAILIGPTDPWAEAPKPPLPNTYCADVAAYWVKRLAPGETVLDLVGVCGFHLLHTGAKLHPPFTFAPLWLRQFDHPWIGHALAADGSPAAAAARLRKALAPGSSAGLILADNQLLREVRNQGWRHWFFKEWRLVWFSRLEGRDPEERLGSLAALVRRGGG